MLIDNSNELIQQKPKEAFTFDDVKFDDIPSTDKKNDLDTGVDLINSTESSLPMPQIKMPEALDSEYQPDTEQALIDYVMSQNNKIEVASIITKWEIGRCIRSFYKGKYGDRELEKISKESGIGRDNLNKMIKFANQYNRDQLKTLIKGSFIISWNGIAQNLTIKPEKLIEVYENANNIDEFHNGIMKCKNPDEKRGKSKLPKSDEAKEKDDEKQIKVVPEIIPDESVPAEYNEPANDIDIDKLAQHHETYEKELETLKLENKRLEEELLSRDKKIKELEKNLAKANQEKEKYEGLFYVYTDKLDKVKRELENNTPAWNIIAWIEQGDDD